MIREIVHNMLLSLMIVNSCSTSGRFIIYNEQSNGIDSLIIKEGLVCTQATNIIYQTDYANTFAIEVGPPIKVSQAEHEESWGYFQFPSIGKAEDGTLIVSWQMNEDTPAAYGKLSERTYFPLMSKDGGLTWSPQDKQYKTRCLGYNVVLESGEELQVVTPTAKDVNSYSSFPTAVSQIDSKCYYYMDSVPDELQGVYLKFQNDSNTSVIHATLNDHELLRYSNDDLMPVVWWGNIKELSDKSLVAGVYPAYYKDEVGKVLPCSVSFYKSLDKGESWNVIGGIPFSYDGIAETRGDVGYFEPAFEILPDSSFICVMRTGSTSPMYQSFSYDRGCTWSTPEPFTPNGVKPQLLLLKNGVLVLASGRPGIQLRFSFDGLGHKWSDPIDMIPFMNDNTTYIRDVSCGYASILEADCDSFYLVYSDFTTKNSLGETRKSIWFRKVTIKQYIH